MSAAKDTLSGIAPNFLTTAARLAALNPGVGSLEELSGRVINVPIREIAVEAGETLVKVSDRYGVSVATIRALNPDMPREGPFGTAETIQVSRVAPRGAGQLFARVWALGCCMCPFVPMYACLCVCQFPSPTRSRPQMIH